MMDNDFTLRWNRIKASIVLGTVQGAHHSSATPDTEPQLCIHAAEFQQWINTHIFPPVKRASEETEVLSKMSQLASTTTNQKILQLTHHLHRFYYGADIEHRKTSPQDEEHICVIHIFFQTLDKLQMQYRNAEPLKFEREIIKKETVTEKVRGGIVIGDQLTGFEP